MILDPSKINDYGLRVDLGIPEEVLRSETTNAELLVLKPMLSNEEYNNLVELAHNEPENVLLIGGEYTSIDGEKFVIGGINRAIANIAFAFILRNRVMASAYGSVIKENDKSSNPDVYTPAHENYNIGMLYIREYCKAVGIVCNKPDFMLW